MKQLAVFALLACLTAIPSARAGAPVPAAVSPATREALAQSARQALGRLGQADGFFADAQVRIGLPKNFARADKVLRMLGQGGKVDDLVRGMNRAAEQSLTRFASPLQEALNAWTPETAPAEAEAAAEFRKASAASLYPQMLIALDAVAEPSDLAGAYDRLAQTLRQLAGLRGEFASVREYVARRTLDGLFVAMAEEERRLRAAAAPMNLPSPQGAGTEQVGTARPAAR